ncbi:hypothetical protein [Priestia koreensis]|uniref:hypothetical protein n=1 Tax=Priestia koreensis TaxID=284581 RepID=UPI00345991E4
MAKRNIVTGNYYTEINILANKYILEIGIYKQRKMGFLRRFIPVVSDKVAEDYDKAGLSHFIDY